MQPLQINHYWANIIFRNVIFAFKGRRLSALAHWVMRATYVGRWRKAAITEVSNISRSTHNIHKVTGRHKSAEVTVKEEPKAPAQPTSCKHKAYSTADGQSIGFINVLKDDPTSTQPIGKRTQTAGHSAKLEGVIIPWATRKSTQNGRVASKADLSKLYKWLRWELGAVARTFEELSKHID